MQDNIIAATRLVVQQTSSQLGHIRVHSLLRLLHLVLTGHRQIVVVIIVVVVGGLLDVLLQQVEESIRPATSKGVDALARVAPAPRLEDERVLLVAVATEALQWPLGRWFPFPEEGQVRAGHLQLTAPQIFVVDIDDAEDVRVLVVYVRRRLTAHATHGHPSRPRRRRMMSWRGG